MSQTASSAYIFVLCPPFSGSTVLWKLLATSEQVASLPEEGQFIPEVKSVMRKGAFIEHETMPWSDIKEVWESYWDNKQYKLEKSPPNLTRALEIEQTFLPSYFVIMIRDPYAFCEGYRRRTSKSLEESVVFWQICARYQMKNIESLQRVIWFSYEEFTENTSLVVEKIKEFIPDIGVLDGQGEFKSQSVYGPISRKISNLNNVKICKLSSEEIGTISKVLSEDLDLLHYFNYELIEGGTQYNLWRFRTQAKLKTISNWERAKRLYTRRMPRQ